MLESLKQDWKSTAIPAAPWGCTLAKLWFVINIYKKGIHMTSAEFEEKKTTSLFHPRSIQAFSKMITNTADLLVTALKTA